MNILQFAVTDSNYPRNQRLRRYLEKQGATVRLHERSTARCRVYRIASDLYNLCLESKGCDVLILSEFALEYSIFTWFVSRWRRALHIVDGFIGMYETAVEDRQTTDPKSVKALLMKLIDNISRYSADHYLADTAIRASRVEPYLRRASRAWNLPVGAPVWAVPQPYQPHSRRRYLYYGGFIPLHGVDVILRAASILQATGERAWTFIGNGQTHAEMRSLCSALGLDSSCTFHLPVPEPDLRGIIADHDVVFGIFGSSLKAKSVIANKVWQGLACGRTVITCESSALQELRELTSPQSLVQIRADPGALAEAILIQEHSDRRIVDCEVADRLETYVNSKYQLFYLALKDSVLDSSHVGGRQCGS